MSTYSEISPLIRPRVTIMVSSNDSIASKDLNVIQVYNRRWYILCMFGLYGFCQNCAWNTWGPISTSSEAAFNWNDATVAWLTNWGPVSYILTGLFLPWLLQRKGLRWAILLSMSMVVAGTICRVITSDPEVATILIHFGQFLNGVAGPVAMAGYPVLSATWFPPHERVTATALATSICAFGSAMAFVLGPLFVSVPSNYSSSAGNTGNDSHNNGNYSAWIPKGREEIMHYMYAQCGWSALVFICLLCYFPAKPPHPPCVSASVERDHYWAGLWSLRKKIYFLIVGATYGVSLGVLNVWISVLNINLKSVVSQDTAGWMGFYATIGACLLPILIGIIPPLIGSRLADVFTQHIKFIILGCYILGTILLVVFVLELELELPYKEAFIYGSVVSSYSLFNAAVPMMYELACELAYPASESAANGLLTYFNNFWGLIFLAVFSFPNIGTMWMNWVAIAAVVVCIPLIAVLRGRFNRLEVDRGVVASINQDIVVSQEKVVHQDYIINHPVQV